MARGNSVAGNAGGFGIGFGKAFLNTLNAKRERQREDTQRQEARKDREFQMLFPVMWKEAVDSGDFEGFESWFGQYQPDLSKKFQKEGSPFQHLAPLLSGGGSGGNGSGAAGGYVSQQDGERYGRILQQQKGAAPAPTGGPTLATRSRPTTYDEQQVIPGMPSTVEGKDSRLFGMAMPQPEERVARTERAAISKATIENKATLDLNQKQVEQRLQQARELGMSPTDAVRFAATGQMPREDYSITDAENFNEQVKRFTAEKGRPPTMEEVSQMRQEWYRQQAAGAGRQPNLEEMAFEAYARDVAKKPVNQLTFAERMDARRKYGQSDDAAQRPWAPIVIQTPNGPAIVDRAARTAQPIIGADQQPVPRNPTAVERKDLGNLQTLASAMEAVKTSYKPNLVGPLVGRYGSTSQSVPLLPVPEGFADLSSKLASVNNLLTNMRSGQQVTPQEADRIKAELPQLTDKPEVFTTKIANALSLLETMAANRQANMGVAPKAAAAGGTDQQVSFTYTDPADGKRKTVTGTQAKIDLFKRALKVQ